MEGYWISSKQRSCSQAKKGLQKPLNKLLINGFNALIQCTKCTLYYLVLTQHREIFQEKPLTDILLSWPGYYSKPPIVHSICRKFTCACATTASCGRGFLDPYSGRKSLAYYQRKIHPQQLPYNIIDKKWCNSHRCIQASFALLAYQCRMSRRSINSPWSRNRWNNCLFPAKQQYSKAQTDSVKNEAATECRSASISTVWSPTSLQDLQRRPLHLLEEDIPKHVQRHQGRSDLYFNQYCSVQPYKLIPTFLLLTYILKYTYTRISRIVIFGKCVKFWKDSFSF